VDPERRPPRPEPDGSVTSPSLLGRLAREPSDQDAWREFVRRYGPRIHAWCRSRGVGGNDAEDLTQVVLARLTARMRHFTYDPSRSFRGWLRALTRNACHDALVAIHRPDVGGRGWDELARDAEAREDLVHRLEEEFDLELLDEAKARVRSRVAEHTWEAFRLTAVEGLPAPRVAGLLAMKVTAVYLAKSRVVALLRDEIRSLEGEPS
jgi:RNA polymerase sigma-70 factor (ECF subfamily)